MQLKDTVTHTIPPTLRTARGEPSFLQASPQYLLYFNGCTVVLRPHDNSTCLQITHLAPVAAAKFSHGYNMVASIDEKGTLFIHHIDNGQVKLGQTYGGCYVGAKAMDWTADNKRLCLVGSAKPKYGRVISVDMGTDVGEIGAVTANLTTASFRPDKPYKLAIGGEEFMTKCYQGPPYKFVASKKSHTNFINQLKYSPDGSKIVSVGSDRKIVLYNGLTFEIEKQLGNAHEGGIMGVAWLGNDSFVTGGSDKKLKKWSVELQKQAELNSTSEDKQLALVDAFIVAVCFCPQKQSVFFATLAGEIKQTDKNLSVIAKSYQSYRNKPVKLIPLNHESKCLLLDSCGKILTINTENSECQRNLRRTLCHNRMMLDFCLGSDGRVYFLTGQQEVGSFELNTQPDKIQLTSVDGAVFLTALGSPGEFACYTRQHIKVYRYKNDKHGLCGEAKIGYQPTVVQSQTDASHNNSNHVFIGSGKGKVEIYSIQSHQNITKIQKVCEFQPSGYRITHIHRHGDLLFTGDSMGAIRVFRWTAEIAEPVKVAQMGSHTTVISSIRVHGEHIYTFSIENKYSIWRLGNFSRITTFAEVHKHGILGAEVVAGKILTFGGDLLVKVHQL